MRLTNKSLRQIANLRYTPLVENYVQAPRRRLFSFPSVFSFTFAPRNRFVSACYTLSILAPPQAKPFQQLAHSSQNTGGYTPQLSHFGTHAGETRLREPFPRRRLRNHGPSRSIFARSPQKISAPNHHPHHHRARSIFTCNKKAIYFTVGPFGGNASPAHAVYKVMPFDRTDLQETDR